MATKKTREELVQEFLERLEARETAPKKTPQQLAAEREVRLHSRLEAARQAREKEDRRRLKHLLREASLRVDAGDMPGVFALAAELAYFSRIVLVGLEAAHPVGQTLPPEYRPSGLPGDTNDEGEV